MSKYEVSKAVDGDLRQAIDDAEPDITDTKFVFHGPDERRVSLERRDTCGLISWTHKRWDGRNYKGGGSIASVAELKEALDWALDP